MLKKTCVLGLLAAAAGLPASGEEARRWAFDGPDALSGWTVSGDAAADATKNREGRGGSLKVGPGGKALLKLRDADGSGKVEMWVYDDATRPENPKGDEWNTPKLP